MQRESCAGQQILVVDDEPEICELLEHYLDKEGYRVYCVENGDAMHRILAQTHIDLVILDVRLPGKDGFILAQEIRQNSAVGIIMLTHKSDVIDRVVGLESGADDYLAKPFHPRELLARIRTVLRRSRESTITDPFQQVMSFAGWRLYPETHQLFSPQGEEAPLSPTEFDLLSVFLQHPNRVLNRDFLLDLTRGRLATPFDRAIDVHVSHLRKKIEPNPKQPTIIKTVRNFGYIFTAAVTRE